MRATQDDFRPQRRFICFYLCRRDALHDNNRGNRARCIFQTAQKGQIGIFHRVVVSPIFSAYVIFQRTDKLHIKRPLDPLLSAGV